MADTYEFRFRKRYNLPPTDPRYLAATIEEIITDYWAHAHVDDPKLRNELVSDDYDAQLAALEAEIMAEAEAEAAAAAERGEAPPPAPAPAYVMPDRPAGMDEQFEEVFSDRY